METVLKLLNRADWLLAGGCLTYGAYAMDWRWALAGAVSLGIAWYNPSRRVKAWLETKMLASPKRRQEQAARAAAVRIAQEEAAYEAAPSTTATPANFGRRVTGYGPVHLNASKHNQLRPGAGNLLGQCGKTWF